MPVCAFSSTPWAGSNARLAYSPRLVTNTHEIKFKEALFIWRRTVEVQDGGVTLRTVQGTAEARKASRSKPALTLGPEVP